jgi:hypothetical protein
LLLLYLFGAVILIGVICRDVSATAAVPGNGPGRCAPVRSRRIVGASRRWGQVSVCTVPDATAISLPPGPNAWKNARRPRKP